MPTIYTGSETPTGALNLTVVGTIALAGAEISAFDAATNRFFVTSASGLQIIDATDPTSPSLITTIPIATLSANGGDITSVAANNGVLAVAVPNTDKTQPGEVVFVDAATGSVLGVVVVGALPDMVTFSPDGSKVLVANEGEPLVDGDGTLIDPVGRISIIDISGGVASATVTHAGFDDFNGDRDTLDAAGVRIDPGKSVAQAMEPEYIAISADGTKAVITLQENNAFALLDLATNTITDIVPLGFKDHSLAGNELDPSDRDSASNGGINIASWPLMGMYQPDAIASYEIGGQTYYVTANEGDAYDGHGQSEREFEARVKDLTLDPTAFPNAADLQQDEQIGRLEVSTLRGDTDGDGDIDELHSYGGRSFSIWDGQGNLVFDSGSVIERAIAALVPDKFNSNGNASSFDTRSDAKGAEPEGVTIGTVDGKTYAFVGLERTGGVMAFDITDPANVTFAQYADNAGTPTMPVI